jgi:hypothetical protein
MSQQAGTHATRQAATAKAEGGRLQRKCACGTHTIGGAECDGCRGEGRKPQRAAVGRAETSGAQADATGAQSRPQSVRGFQHDLSRVPAATVGGGARSFVSSQRHVLQASVRRVPAAPQSDSTGDGVGQKPAASSAETQEPQTPAATPRGEAREPTEGETRHFSDIPSVAAAESQDTIASNLTYTSPIDKVTAPQSPDKFGQTSPVIAVNRSTATQEPNVFKVELVVDNKISFWVHGGGRTDIASDSDPDITQTNYPTVVSDLTPSPAAVKNATTNLYKNQPPRAGFWAEDLTIRHERCHANEDKKFGGQGAAIGRDWLNTQTASSFDQIGPMLHTVAVKVAAKIDQEMAVPASEERAYDDGAPSYTARAQAIKTKGDAKGYAAKPPAQQTPNPPPQNPNPPPSATPQPPAPK